MGMEQITIMRNEVILRRIAGSCDGVFGAMIEDDHVIVSTLERPNIYNIKDYSCIPEGSYICKRIDSPSHGNTFEVIDVPGRTDIQFHIGNTINDTKGCMLVGS